MKTKLNVTHPNLVDEWNYSKNSLGPENYTFGSGIKVWWTCEHNHEWQAAITNRTKGGDVLIVLILLLGMVTTFSLKNLNWQNNGIQLKTMN